MQKPSDVYPIQIDYTYSFYFPFCLYAARVEWTRRMDYLNWYLSLNIAAVSRVSRSIL